MDVTTIDIASTGQTCENHSLQLQMSLGGNAVVVAIPTKAKFLAGDPSDQIEVVSNSAGVPAIAILAALIRIRSHVKETLPNATPAQIRTNLQSQSFKI